MVLGVGTTNYNLGRVDYGGGESWAGVVGDIASYVANSGGSYAIYVNGADDIEPDWSPNNPGAVFNWVNGFNYINPANYIDYGSADGCPGTGNGTVNENCDAGWTFYHLWFVSWGATTALALPEIYRTDALQAAQWTQISLYAAVSQSGRIYFEGPLDQYDRCLPGSYCYNVQGLGNTPDQAWNQLWNGINGYSQTASNLKYSAEVHGTGGY